MSPSKDSSVLFALDELRQHEAERVEREAALARERSAVARRQADAAAKKRAEAKNNAQELVALRGELARQHEREAELQSTVAELEAVVRMPRAPVSPPAPVEIVRESRSHHFLWGAALLFSCLGVFVATYEPSVPPTPAPALAAAEHECPELAEPAPMPAAVVETPAKSAPAAARQAIAPSPSKRSNSHRSGRKGKGKPEVSATESLADSVRGCDGPLCGLPD